MSVRDTIRRALLAEWDPIGVRDVREAQDEYDGYVAGIYALLIADAPAQTIAEHLATVERESMGLTPNAAGLMQVAMRLKQIDVHSAPA